MSTKMTVKHRFEADASTLAALLADPEFLKQKYAAVGATEVVIVAVDDRGGAPRVESSRKVTVDLPGFAAKVMQPTNTVVQVDDWSAADAAGAFVCKYTVEVKGVPSRIDGTVTLRPDGNGTVQDVVADVKISIPLLGGRLEKFAVSSGLDQLKAEADFTARHLAAG